MPFQFAQDDHNSSAGGGDPIEPSMHSAGGYEAVVNPKNNERAFIFERQSESTQQRPSDAHVKLNLLSSNNRPILDRQSLTSQMFEDS